MDEDLDAPGIGESAHTTGRKSARSQRVEIITRGERRRVWTLEQKREIVAESLGPELTPTEVARKHAISSGQLYTWRRQLLSMPGAVVTRAVPAVYARWNRRRPRRTPQGRCRLPSILRLCLRRRCVSDGMIEIVLPGGVSLRVDAQVDGRALRRVLDALDRR